MGTNIRPEISSRKKYYLTKHRYYELLHFCRQYDDYDNEVRILEQEILKSPAYEEIRGSGIPDKTQEYATRIFVLTNKMDMIRDCCNKADPDLSNYIFKAVTKGDSFVKLTMVDEIPCSKNTFYDRYRKFFWLLSNIRG